MTGFDAVVVGGGPNGLAAAVELARNGRSTLVLEAKETIGGGTRTAELTLPEFHHDVCSAIHPLAAASPFFSQLPLGGHGLEWIRPPVPLAHPFDNGTAALLEHSISDTGRTLGPDAGTYARLFGPLVSPFPGLAADMLGPLRVPRHPIPFVRFGLLAMLPATTLCSLFRGYQARALFAGLAAHVMTPLDLPFSSAIGVTLGLAAHVVGWPFPRGGSDRITTALASYLQSLGGTIQTGRAVKSLDDLPEFTSALFDTDPTQLVTITGKRLPGSYRRKLKRFRYGPGVFKVDYALDGPVPWKAAECSQAGTVHLGGTFEEIAAAERDAWFGRTPERPLVLVAQQSLFDDTRAPAGKQTVWAYCHVPNGSTVDMTTRVEAQIERFAPGFRDRVLARHVMRPADFEAYNPNDRGGDIGGGATDLLQLFTRPVARPDPYSTPDPSLFLCSASTPPGGGVHGMCGYHAARSVLKRSSGCSRRSSLL